MSVYPEGETNRGAARCSREVKGGKRSGSQRSGFFAVDKGRNAHDALGVGAHLY